MIVIWPMPFHALLDNTKQPLLTDSWANILSTSYHPPIQYAIPTEMTSPITNIYLESCYILFGVCKNYYYIIHFTSALIH